VVLIDCISLLFTLTIYARWEKIKFP